VPSPVTIGKYQKGSPPKNNSPSPAPLRDIRLSQETNRMRNIRTIGDWGAGRQFGDSPAQRAASPSAPAGTSVSNGRISESREDSALAERVDKLCDGLKKVIGQRDQARAQCDALAAQLERARRDIKGGAESSNRAAQLTSKLEAARARASKLDNEKRALVKQLQRSNARAEDYRERLADALGAARDARMTGGASAEELARAQAELQASRRKVASLEASIAALEASRSIDDQWVEGGSGELFPPSAPRGRDGGAESAKSESRALAAALAAEAEATASLERMQKTLTATANRLAQVRERAEALGADNQKVRSILAAREAELQQASAQRHELEGRLLAAQRQIGALEEACAAAEQRTAQARMDASSSRDHSCKATVESPPADKGGEIENLSDFIVGSGEGAEADSESESEDEPETEPEPEAEPEPAPVASCPAHQPREDPKVAPQLRSLPVPAEALMIGGAAVGSALNEKLKNGVRVPAWAILLVLALIVIWVVTRLTRSPRAPEDTGALPGLPRKGSVVQ